MRRESIYPHRSVRTFPISGLRLFLALAVGILLTGTVGYFRATLLSTHNRLSSYILDKTQIPATSASMQVFRHVPAVAVPETTFPAPRANPVRTVILFSSFLAGLLLMSWRFPLSRNFAVFLMILLCTAGAVILFIPSFHFDSGTFGNIWLRGEYLVWLLLPWVSAFLFVLTLPSAAAGVGWALLIEIYAILWSAFRFAFCLGTLHFTGILFLPLLWFCLGILFDLVYILAFYSLALRWSMGRGVSGRRP